ncbi:MAG: sigma-70 family RNA polymerase sigma factor [Planctomycetota bacterium]|jgi:RNA polymerase sigma factor (sigma-70 family)|nr:sigma-70 family RNA polymerase sigma factor [Planctomycetota bacterium]MDP7254922.1 sigma-70 family RNA polymerase sigma factor [Planctomycetota bacterium]
MASEGSVTQWLAQLKAGDEEALGQIQGRYWKFLVKLADRQLDGAPRRVEDEEDVAQKAFWSFYNSVKDGRIPRLVNRSDLLSLLVVITARRASDQVEHHQRQKRGGGKVRGESALDFLNHSTTDARGLDAVAGDALSPEEEATLNDSYRQYLDELPEKFREFAELYIAGFTYPEIAEAMDCSERTVARRIPMILEQWQQMARDSLTR